jgi:hypothetical protein
MRTRPTVMKISALALVVLAVGLVTAPAANAAAFRYWTFWEGSGSTWTFATQGPATSVPVDGAVEGWRFAVTTQAGTGQDIPRVAPDFATICKGTPPAEGRKRVGLVIDAGPAAMAPDGQTPPATVATCVVMDPDATGFQVLSSVADVRTEGGLICSLAGYPQGECAPILGDAEAQRIAQAAASPGAGATPAGSAGGVDGGMAGEPASAAADTGSPWATIAVAVLLIAGAAIGAARYRRGTDRYPNGRSERSTNEDLHG